MKIDQTLPSAKSYLHYTPECDAIEGANTAECKDRGSQKRTSFPCQAGGIIMLAGSPEGSSFETETMNMSV